MTIQERQAGDWADLDGDAVAIGLGRAFSSAGEELYLVGGAVRDRALGQEDLGLNLDFATSARPEQTARILERLHAGSIFRMGEKFGTIGMQVGDRLIEITTYRAEEHYPAGSRKPEVRFGRTLLEDLSRRDFTINAVAQNPLTGELVDPFHGMDDIAAGLLRAVGQPAERFREDPLRLLRAVRLASRLGFDVESETWNAMRVESASLQTISRERVRDEYTRMLEGPRPAEALALLRDSNLLMSSMPVLDQLTLMPDHGPFHPLSLWDHTMRVVEGVPQILSVRWAAVLHDIAKPSTRTHEPNGRPRFFRHDEVGAEMAREALTALRYSNSLVDDVTLLVETHMQLHSYSAEWTDGAVRRLMLRLGPLMHLAIALARADGAAHALTGVGASAPKFDALEERVRLLGQETVAAIKSPLTGDDLMARYGRGPGPWIRTIKDAIYDALVEGDLQSDNVEGAWKIADQVVQSRAE